MRRPKLVLPVWRPPYPQAIERVYAAALRRVAYDVFVEAQRVLLPAYRSALAQRELDVRRDDWPETLETALGWLNFSQPIEAGQRAIRRTTEALRLFGGKAYQAFARQVMGLGAIQSEPKLDPLLRAWSQTNATLISSIPDQFHTAVAGRVQEMVRQGRSLRDFSEELRKQYNLTVNRANLIARTEVAKLNSAITRERQEALGLDVYVWRSSRDERVRESHKVLDGKYCKYSDTTVYADGPEGPWKKRVSLGGYQGDPGTDFQCRCTASADVRSRISSLRRAA